MDDELKRRYRWEPRQHADSIQCRQAGNNIYM
jgi:hypothetical protein